MTATPCPADGKYVDVFIPISFRRFGGRRTIVAHLMGPGSCIDAGAYDSIAEMAHKEGINRTYLSRPSGWRCWRPTSSKPS